MRTNGQVVIRGRPGNRGLTARAHMCSHVVDRDISVVNLSPLTPLPPPLPAIIVSALSTGQSGALLIHVLVLVCSG